MDLITMMKSLALALLALAACSSHPAPATPPPPVVIQYEMHGEVDDTGTGSLSEVSESQLAAQRARPTTESKVQPSHVKLKLGHYKNDRMGVGVIVDRISAATENVADIDPVKLRFDNESTVWTLQGHHGGPDRLDYVRDHGGVMLELYDDGNVAVRVYDPETELSSDAIFLYRDADADPLL